MIYLIYIWYLIKEKVSLRRILKFVKKLEFFGLKWYSKLILLESFFFIGNSRILKDLNIGFRDKIIFEDEGVNISVEKFLLLRVLDFLKMQYL